jgi:hypothetical protein
LPCELIHQEICFKEPMLIGFILLYLTGTLAIGWWASRNVKTASDFVVAGRHLPVYMVACALFATWFGSETVMGASSEFAEHGLLGIIEDPFGAALCLVLAGLLIARPLYNMNILTFNDFFEIRFGRRAEIISAFLMVPSFFSWITAQIVALAIVMQSVTGLEYHWGVLLCTTMVLGYTYIGGMWSVTVTDFFQTIAIIIGLTVLAVEMVSAVGGFGKMAEAAPAGFFQFFPDTGKPINVVHWFAAWMTYWTGKCSAAGCIPAGDVGQKRARLHYFMLHSGRHVPYHCCAATHHQLLRQDAVSRTGAGRYPDDDTADGTSAQRTGCADTVFRGADFSDTEHLQWRHARPCHRYRRESDTAHADRHERQRTASGNAILGSGRGYYFRLYGTDAQQHIRAGGKNRRRSVWYPCLCPLYRACTGKRPVRWVPPCPCCLA